MADREVNNRLKQNMNKLTDFSDALATNYCLKWSNSLMLLSNLTTTSSSPSSIESIFSLILASKSSLSDLILEPPCLERASSPVGDLGFLEFLGEGWRVPFADCCFLTPRVDGEGSSTAGVAFPPPGTISSLSYWPFYEDLAVDILFILVFNMLLVWHFFQLLRQFSQVTAEFCTKK